LYAQVEEQQGHGNFGPWQPHARQAAGKPEAVQQAKGKGHHPRIPERQTRVTAPVAPEADMAERQARRDAEGRDVQLQEGLEVLVGRGCHLGGLLGEDLQLLLQAADDGVVAVQAHGHGLAVQHLLSAPGLRPSDHTTSYTFSYTSPLASSQPLMIWIRSRL